MNKRRKRFVVFIDLEKAFDRVDRRILINKMKDQNLNPAVIDMIGLTLNNNKAKIENKSIVTQVGTPQGDVLSPTLFNIYFN